MKGIKIRVMETKMYIDMFKALGAEPTPMARGELSTALQTGTVDAQDNPIGQTYTSRFYEVQKYITLSGHTYSPEPVVFSLATWMKIPANYQEAILKASAEARKYNRELNASLQEDYIKKCKEKGMVVTILSPQQKKMFQEKMMPVWDMFADKIGKDLIQKIQSTKFLDVMAGDQTLFWRQDGLETCWAFYEPLLAALDTCGHGLCDLHPYAAGSWGPAAALEMLPPGSWPEKP